MSAGYTEGFLRKSVVGDPLIRENTKDNTPAVIHYSIVPGDQVKITMAPKGFGSEIWSRVFMLKPADGIEGVKHAILTAVKDAGPNACPPMVVGVGIGGTFEKCALLAKQALTRPVDEHSDIPYVKDLEEEMLSKINQLGIGPGGLGGTTTALAININTYPTHIAGTSGGRQYLPLMSTGVVRTCKIVVHVACCAQKNKTTGFPQNENPMLRLGGLKVEDADKYITMPITEETTAELKAGDYVYLTGTMYVARDAAHKRMIEALDEGGELPIDIRDATIYYMGPSPAREGASIGSAGPTTATRMDKYAPRLLDLGEKAMIGKGKRSKEVVDAVIRNHAVYFAAIGGAGALLSKCITKSEIVCYEDLGAEAIRKIEVKDFPVIVVIDREGNNLYETAIQQYHTLEEM